MPNENLNGLKVAILVTDGFEQVELTEPRKALDQAGRDVKGGQVAAGSSLIGGKTFPWT